MPRIDKYEPLTGGFRAPLAAAITSGQVGAVLGVGLDSSGRVVVGAGTSGIKGVINPNEVMAAGDIIDVAQDADILEMVGLAAGVNVFVDGATGVPAAGTGTLLNTGPATAGSAKIGHMVEATRLVVRVGRA